jgi:hypothetical protein
MSKKSLIKILFGVLTVCTLTSSNCTGFACLIKGFNENPATGVYRLLASTQELPLSQYQDDLIKLQLLSNNGLKTAKIALAQYYFKQQQYHLIPDLIDTIPEQNKLLAEVYDATQQFDRLLKLPSSKQIAPFQLKALMARGEVVPTNIQQNLASPRFSFTDLAVQSCRDNILTVVTSWQSYNAAKAIVAQFKNMHALDICFSEPVYIATSEMPCAVLSGMARCQVSRLERVLPVQGFSKLVIVTDHGKANAGSGVVHMNARQSAHVLLMNIPCQSIM